MTIHAMIDLETLDVTPQSQILTIGAVKFNPYDYAEPHSEFYVRLEIDEQEENGRTTSQSTLDWWGTQPESIIMEAFSPDNRTSVTSTLRALKKWYVGCDAVWAQGVCFDISMLEDICRQFKEPIPWPFYHVNDSRTMLKLLKIDPRKQFSFAAHNALEDARIQAKAVQIAFDKLNLENN